MQINALNIEKEESLNRIQMHSSENRYTTKHFFTQEDKMNLKLIKKIMKKTTLPSLRNQDRNNFT